MSDIDFITDLSGTFSIAIGDSPKAVSGNRALLNRFELTFLSKRRPFLFDEDQVVYDNYGGDASKFIDRPSVLNDMNSVSASIALAIDQTVKSMKENEPSNVPDTERISSADLLSLNIVDEIVVANIRVQPVEVEPYAEVSLNLPIVRRS